MKVYIVLSHFYNFFHKKRIEYFHRTTKSVLNSIENRKDIIGQNQVQGIDYAYTLQGWLKGVNSTAVGDGAHNMGGDGALTARDAYGFSLNYFNGDYQPIGTAAPFAPVSIGNNLYNGNIKAMAVNIPTLGDARVYKYGYDQLNRLVAMDAYGGLNNSASTFSPVLLDDYKEQITYDPNGNILTYKRNGDAVRLTMDNLTYSYKPNTNQLDKVTDAAPDAAAGEYDKYNDIRQGQQNGNYQYDAIGNLISDVSEGITNIEWTVYGKIKSITKTGGVNISYSYDAAGNRISKNVNGKETWYVRDASGNVMSVYSKEPTQHSGHLIQAEVHLYGSARLGILNTDTDMELSPVGVSVVTFETGYRHYELTNHLGNVLATVSDRKLSHSTDGTYIDYYTADVVSANDYYPGGMIMPGRRLSNGNQYRYGFNGKEQDKETAGTTTYDYGFRIYNPGLGRFLSVDPLTASYPWYTPYQFAGNKPIWALDVDGLEDIIYQEALKKQTAFKLAIEVISETKILENFYLKVKKQNKFDVAFVEFDAKRTNPSGEIYEDAGWSGNTSVISSKEDWVKNYVANHIPFEEIEASIKSGKKIIIIGISRQKLNTYTNLAQDDILKGEDFLSLTSITETIVHESKAHALNRLLGMKESAEDEHEKYNGDRSFYSPTLLELLFDKKFSRTEAGKDTRKIYNYLRDDHRKVLEFNSNTSNPNPENHDTSTKN